MADKPNKFRIGISMGDLNGIGIEVILKALVDKRILDFCTPIIYGSSKALSYYRNMLGIDKFSQHNITSLDRVSEKSVNVLNCWDEVVNIVPGEASEEMGKYALNALDMATNDLMEGKINAIVTGPVNKFLIQKHQQDFSGQTEHIARKLDIDESLMLMLSEGLRVGLITTHVPVAEVASLITRERILAKLELFNKTLKKDFLIQKPKIAVLGLNPHAGDNGLIGNEEQEIITPALEEARDQNILAFGPYAADGFFGSGGYKQFDGILAMYHDQGLTAFKVLTFGSGVNYTAGLPIVRTSPDHGTAYDIAGKNKANEESFRNALFMAIDILNNRYDHGQMYSNPLSKSQLRMSPNSTPYTHPPAHMTKANLVCLLLF
jgi:4-hydroxythreonine-4-phosphate dehydrogenase